MAPKVSIVILNYNGRKHVIDCLRSLEKITYKNTEIILYDNGSSDDISEEIKQKFKKVRVIRRTTNIGFSGGNTDAYRYSHGKYLLLLNNDTTVTKAFLTALVKRMEKDPQIGIVQPKIVFQRTKKLQSGCVFFTSTGFLYYLGFGKDPGNKTYNIPMQVHSANGACMLIRREVIEKIGLFDKDFFLYFEETDFCHRALLAGYTVWYEPKATIYHIGSVDNSRYKYSLLVYYSFRNRLVSYIKNLGLASLFVVLPVHTLLCIGLIFAYLFSGKPESSLAVCKALMYNIQNIRHTLQKRAYVQKHLRRLADGEFLLRVTRFPRIEYYLRLFTGLERYID